MRTDPLILRRRCVLFGALQRQPHQHFGAPAPIGTQGSVEKLNAAAVILKYLDDNRQAEPRSLGSRRDIGLDQTAPIFARKPLAIVADSNLREACAIHGNRGYDDTFAVLLAQSINTFGRILQHVGKRLRNQPPIEVG